MDLQGYNIVSEALGEYKEIDSRMNSMWLNIVDNFKAIANQTAFFTNSKEYPKESSLISDVVHGPKIIVRAVTTHNRNAFVIPGIVPTEDIEEWKKNAKEWVKKHRSGYEANFIPPICFFFMKSIKRLKNMMKYKVEKNGDHNRIIFPKSTIPLNIFVTYGLLAHMTPEERIAIYLHEIGHWVDAANSIPPEMLEDDNESIYYAYTMMYQRLIARYQEIKADKFAHIAGYGPELHSALTSLTNRRKNVHIFSHFADINIAGMVEWDNEREKRGTKFDPQEYPSMEKRKELLKKYEEEKSK